MSHMLRVFIGWDPAETIAYHVLAHSIIRRSSIPVSITPLRKGQLGMYTKPKGPTESTEFAMTRFLVPYLCDYKGWAVFMDCDMLCLTDFAELELEMLTQRDKAVLVCQHEYTPKMGPKFLGQPQTAYPRKNWSSFMVFNNARCAALSPEYINRATGLDLHRFHWLQEHAPMDELGRIGSLPLDWNWLVGEYDENPNARILHYTRGGPWFDEYRECDHAKAWFDERSDMQTHAPVMV